MKNFDASITAEIAKENFTFFFTLEMQFDISTLYMTDSDRRIVSGGNTYTPYTFRFDNIAYSAALSVDSLTLVVGNADLTMSATLLGQDIRNRTVIVSLGCLSNTTGAVIAVSPLFRGIVGEWEIGEGEVSITIVNELILWRKKALRSASATCPWEFRGTECGYSGVGSWCDQSYARCVVLVNTIHFGGHRFLPSMAEKQVWWGRKPA